MSFKTGAVVLVSFSLPWISRHLAGILCLLHRWCSGVGKTGLWFQSLERALFCLNYKELLSGLVSTLRTVRLASCCSNSLIGFPKLLFYP